VAAAVSSASAAPAAAFLDALAERIAYGLAAVAAVLDPPLVVLAGDVGRAGGEALAARVTAALRATTPLDTAIAVTGVDADPVLLGAQVAAQQALREQIIATLRDAVPAA
jgi:predicted NBD/HSP70 family sugar kinase